MNGLKRFRRRLLLVATVTGSLLLAAGAPGSFPAAGASTGIRLDGTFRMHFIVLHAVHVVPGIGTTGTRTWIFEHQGSRLFLLEGLSNGGYARVRLHRSGIAYVGTSRLRTTCTKDPSQTASDVSTYKIYITSSVVRSGKRVATGIKAYLHGSFLGCGQPTASEQRRYTGRLIAQA